MILLVGVFHSRLNISKLPCGVSNIIYYKWYDFDVVEVVEVVVVIVVATVPYSLLFGDLYSRFYLMLLASDLHLFNSR